MDENKNVKINNDEEKKVNSIESSEKNKAPAEKQESKNKLKVWFSEIKGEYKMITWPTKETLMKETLTVVFTSLLIGAIISAMDFVLRSGYEGLTNLFSGL